MPAGVTMSRRSTWGKSRVNQRMVRPPSRIQRMVAHRSFELSSSERVFPRVKPNSYKSRYVTSGPP